MSMQKKNVFREFLKDDYAPLKDQKIVKYLEGRGNNLHFVEDYHGNEFLVSMPKKYRKTVWLYRGNCLVIDPVQEGDKVKGEIVCVISEKCVIDLIIGGHWYPEEQENKMNVDIGTLKEEYLKFFKKDWKFNKESSPSPSHSELSGSQDSDSENSTEKEREDKLAVALKSEVNIQVDTKSGSSIKNDYITLMSSSSVTVTTGEFSEQTECESFEFGAECDSSDDTNNGTDVSRLVNAIRIRVSYNGPNDKNTLY